MKTRNFIVMLTVCVLVIVGGMAYRMYTPSPQAKLETPAKRCLGYTVIEANKGIDCNGDTVNLVKTYGYYERVALLDSNQ